MSDRVPSLDGRVFAAIENSADGQVDGSTRFHYRESAGVVSAVYAGGNIVHGRLVGTREEDRLSFRYVQLDVNGATSSGRCTSQLTVLADGRIRADETWAWESGSGAGSSVVEEVPDGAAPPRVVAVGVDAGIAGGHHVRLLSLEIWPERWDLRFARTAVDPDAPLPRRIPPADAWSVVDDAGTTYEVLDVNGRGDRDRSTGEVQLAPRLSPEASRLAVRVHVVAGTEPLTATVDLRQ